MAARKARVIAVVNEKGGVGKTVTAINLGAGLSLNGQDVLIVDMDPQSNATKGLGVSVNEHSASIYDVIKAPNPVPVESAIVRTAWERLDLLPSHADLSGIEVELVNEPGRENRLKDALAPVLGSYDFILVDTPPSLSVLTVNVLVFASEILVPCQTHPYSYGALDELLATVSLAKEEINSSLRIMGVLATFFDQRTRVSHKVLETLRADERLQDMVFDTVIRANTTIAESAYYGKPVLFYRPSSRGASDYLSLTDEILTAQ